MLRQKQPTPTGETTSYPKTRIPSLWLVSLDSLNVEAGRLKSPIKGYDEIVKETDLPKQIFGQAQENPAFISIMSAPTTSFTL